MRADWCLHYWKRSVYPIHGTPTATRQFDYSAPTILRLRRSIKPTRGRRRLDGRGGGLLLLCGLCSCLFYLVLPLASEDTASQVQNECHLSVRRRCFGILFGTVLVWQGINSLRGRSSISAARAFPSLPVFVFAFVGAVARWASQPWGFHRLPHMPFRRGTFLAASLPPLALLAYAAHRLGKASGLRALARFLWLGRAGGDLARICPRNLVALAFVLVAAVVIASLPDSRAIVQQIAGAATGWHSERRISPKSSVVFESGGDGRRWLLYFAVVIPPVEEAVKALVVAFATHTAPGPADALLWGMAAGAGFAVLESMFNASVNLDAWAPLILMRAGASVLHVANGATMGLGWYAARVERRWGRLSAGVCRERGLSCRVERGGDPDEHFARGFGGGSPAVNPSTVLGGVLLPSFSSWCCWDWLGSSMPFGVSKRRKFPVVMLRNEASPTPNRGLCAPLRVTNR